MRLAKPQNIYFFIGRAIKRGRGKGRPLTKQVFFFFFRLPLLDTLKPVAPEPTELVLLGPRALGPLHQNSKYSNLDSRMLHSQATKTYFRTWAPWASLKLTFWHLLFSQFYWTFHSPWFSLFFCPVSFSGLQTSFSYIFIDFHYSYIIVLAKMNENKWKWMKMNENKWK